MTYLELCNVTKEYPLRIRTRAWFKVKSCFPAVKQVNFNLNKGECLGIVGESGSGKSTLAKLIMKIEQSTSGQILLYGQDIKQMRDLDIYKHIQLVFQDSSSSLHPNMSVGKILAEPIHNFFPEQKAKSKEKCIELLKLVGLDDSFLSMYPHQLSGGQKQRVCIAKALAVEPDIIIFDESIASLDKPSQTSIINMLKHIKERKELSYLFITHDLESAKNLCDRVAVMYQGEIIEIFTDWDDERICETINSGVNRHGN